MYFKKIRSIQLPEEIQGYIRYYCLNYYRLGTEVQGIIDNLCMEVGEEDYAALREAMICKHKSIIGIALDYHLSDKRMYKLRRRFYYLFAERYITARKSAQGIG